MDTLAKRFVIAREAKGWRKADLRRAAGLKSPSTLTDLESGKATESPQLAKIADALDVRPLWLQHGTGPMRVDMSKADPQHQIGIKSATQSIIAQRQQATHIRPMVQAIYNLAEQLDDEGLLKLHGFASCLITDHALIKAKLPSSA